MVESIFLILGTIFIFVLAYGITKMNHRGNMYTSNRVFSGVRKRNKQQTQKDRERIRKAITGMRADETS